MINLSVAFLLLQFVTHSSSLTLPDKIQIIDTLGSDYYGSRSIIFLRTSSDFTDAWSVMKAASEARLLAVVTDLPNFLTMTGRYTYPKPVVVVTAASSALLPFAQLSKNIKMPNFNWIFFTDGDKKSFTDFSVPYNCKFVVVSDNVSEIVLKEIYKLTEMSPLSCNTLDNWKKKKAIALPTSGFYSRRWDFQGTQLNHVTDILDPCEGEVSYTRRNVLTCLNEMVWKMTVEALNASTKGLPLSGRAPLDAIRAFRSDPTIHAGVNSHFFLPHYLINVDYFWITSRTELSVFVRNGKMESRWDQYLKPFSTNIWLAALGWLGGCCVALFIARRLGIACLERNHLDAGEGCRREQFWTPIYALLSQGSAEPAESAWERLLLLSAFLMPAVLVPAYGAALTSFLAVQTPHMPFTHLSEMKAHPNYKLTGTVAYNLRNFLQNLQDDTSRYLLQSATLDDQDKPTTELAGALMMCEKPLAFISTSVTMAELNPPCRYYQLSEPFFVFYQSMIMPKNSPYKNIFNTLTRQVVFSGIVPRLSESIISAQMYALFLQTSVEPEEIPSISFDDIVILLIFLCATVFASLAIFMAEIFCLRWSKRFSRPRLFPFHL